MPSRTRRLLPLVFATTATQASIVVLAPLLVEIGRDLGASVSAVGIARSVLAATAVGASLAIGPLIDRIGVRPLIVRGALLALAGAAATALSPSLLVFYAAHALTGLGVACLLSAGFAGVAASFEGRHAVWAMGYVVGAPVDRVDRRQPDRRPACRRRLVAPVLPGAGRRLPRRARGRSRGATQRSSRRGRGRERLRGRKQPARPAARG